jgi:hypothetical protein
MTYPQPIRMTKAQRYEIEGCAPKLFGAFQEREEHGRAPAVLVLPSGGKKPVAPVWVTDISGLGIEVKSPRCKTRTWGARPPA